MPQARCFQVSIHVYMKPEKSLRTRAMKILSRREISRAELKRKLAPYADSEEEIENILQDSNLTFAADSLMEKALAAGGKDNISFIILDLED